VPNENPGKFMCEGQYESLKAIAAIVPGFVPEPYSWGALQDEVGYFLVTDFREVGRQPPGPAKLVKRLAELHKNSRSPGGLFGFHTVTCHGNVPQYVGWEKSWQTMFSKMMAKAMDIDEEIHKPWPEYNEYRRLLFIHVIPRLLGPLESDGRRVKPCLIHGDIWDENCADDMDTSEPFSFDPSSLYAHNEYEIGYWRPARHRLSSPVYIRSYKREFPVSEPGKLVKN
jgi:protein-ribulosamine 3-kinase